MTDVTANPYKPPILAFWGRLAFLNWSPQHLKHVFRNYKTLWEREIEKKNLDIAFLASGRSLPIRDVTAPTDAPDRQGLFPCGGRSVRGEEYLDVNGRAQRKSLPGGCSTGCSRKK